MANVTTGQQQEIVELRALHLTPKQIARKLGLKVSDVNTAIQHQAEETALNRKATGELDPLYQCFATANLVRLLPDNSELAELKKLVENITNVYTNDSVNGLGLVVIAREGKYNELSICSYLLDLWCLGVKDSIAPRKINRLKFKEFVEKSFDAFPEPPQEITISVAQGMIYSALEYADKLGFQPHRDFAESRLHLGDWNGEIRIE
ncbi:MAG: sigma-70 region 4 domain-containing protein, partial [Scytonematopsis contorta HA4267-MV1]|nr:sigma-70 region 4 domain-containing protein [Scytonematopsis contorta HA4267-MV1]